MQTTETIAQARLLFNLEFVNYDEVWRQGYDEGMEALDITENPFPEGSTEHDYWNEGWWSAYYGEAPLFDYDGEVVAQETKTEVAAPAIEIHNVPLFLKPQFWRDLAQIAITLLMGGAVGALCYEFAT